MKKFLFAVAIVLSITLQSQTITTVAGTGTAGFSGDGGLATAAQVDCIYSQLATDNAGNIYLADGNNERIRKITISNGSITTIAGTGVAGFGGDNGPATSAQFYYPQGIAVDNAGNIFVADYVNHRIRKITPTGTITTICGNGTGSSTGDGGLATAATINGPGHLYLDQAGNLYITEYLGNRIRKIANTGSISTICGNGTYTNTGDGGLATAAMIAGPWEIAGDVSGNIYIATYQGSYVRKIAPNGTITAYAGQSASPGFSGDGGPALSAQVNGVTGLGCNTNGDLFIADSANHRIRKVALNGNISTVAGTGTLGYSGDGGNPTSAQIRSPNGAVTLYGCKMYFIDAGNFRIRQVTWVTPTVSAVSSASNYLCSGQTATLSGAGAATYVWNPGALTGSAVAVSPTLTTTYTVVGTSTDGCQNSSALTQTVSSCVSLQEIGSKDEMISVYPNPSNGQLEIRAEDCRSLQIFDVSGRELRRFELVSGKLQLDLSKYGSGIYFLKFSMINKDVITRKAVID